MNKLSDLERGWIAGLIEGEGCIQVSRRPSPRTTEVSVRIAMTDQDVIEKLWRTSGVGRLYERHGASANRKGVYTWVVHVKKDVEDLLVAIMPALGQRRRDRAETALVILHAPRKIRSGPVHGRYSTYTHGCRCASCKSAGHAHSAALWAAKKGGAVEQTASGGLSHAARDATA